MSILKRTGFITVILLIAAAICGALVYLAWDEAFLPGLNHRGLQVQINFEAGQIIFGLLGGGALVWAANTYWRRGPSGGDSGGDPLAPSPTAPPSDRLTIEEQEAFLALEPHEMLLRIYERQKQLEALIRRARPE